MTGQGSLSASRQTFIFIGLQRYKGDPVKTRRENMAGSKPRGRDEGREGGRKRERD